ncbi:MAG: DUF4398 domain-containing protein [Gammaproteobacteria bacterium]|nr:DUF4398 domain-containing protein [Gammaproteobacteria bacterium]TVQ46709.1 MAG: DUF4398 domain-containing protein [Gammaproteobacteria bacterium]
MLVLGVLAGCTSAPVQEMSDARQAIHAAVQSGAAEHAPEQLSQAHNRLALAQQHLKVRRFDDARAEAVEARARATEALYLTEAARRARRD